jgi:protease I
MRASLLLILIVVQAVRLTAAEAPRVLVLLAPGFNSQEFHQSVQPLRAHGYQIDIAASAAGPVTVALDGTPDAKGRDASAGIVLAEIRDPARWCGLLIPGGYAPGQLEKMPDALRICQVFSTAGKPIAAVCHGPRLLARAGLLRGRVVTHLHDVPSELPATWRGGELGTYVDQAVVEDGNLLTARYPNDMGPFTRRFVVKLAAAGGLPADLRPAAIIAIAADLPDAHAAWVLRECPAIVGTKVTLIQKPEEAAKAMEQTAPGSPLAILPGAASAALAAHPALAALLARAGTQPATLPEGSYEAQLPRLTALARVAAPHPDATVPEPARAVLALSPGFDDRAAATALALLQARGHEPLIVAHERGWLRGAAGMPLEATATYAAPPTLAPGAMLIAPGGIWAEHKPDARQGETADWLPAQGARDAARVAWLVQAYKDGARLVTVGYDSLRVAQTKAFPKVAFSAPDSTVWSFGGTDASWSKTAMTAGAERMWSARDAANLAQALLGPASP